MATPKRRTTPPKRRRTQEERREGTIKKLLEAAIDVLVEEGWSGATTQVVAARAGVSQGAIFRHFPTREALMVAVSAEVGRALMERYRRDFDSLRDREEPIALAMRLVRDACRSRTNQAWYELSIAARTSEPLRKALEPFAARYHEAIADLARELLPDLANTMGDRFEVLVDTVVAIFDGEMVTRFVLKRPRLEAARLEMLGAALRAFTG